MDKRTLQPNENAAPSLSVAPLSSLVPALKEERRHTVGLREGVSRTDWKDYLLALFSAGSILMLAAQLIDERPDTTMWQSVLGIALPLVILVVRRLTGRGPQALRNPTSPARVAAAVSLAAGVWWSWDAISERSIASGVLGVLALGVGAAIDRHMRMPHPAE